MHPLPADSFSKYKTNVIPKNVCILTTHISHLTHLVYILLKMNQNRFEIYTVFKNKCVVKMHTFFGIALVLYLYASSQQKMKDLQLSF